MVKFYENAKAETLKFFRFVWHSQPSRVLRIAGIRCYQFFVMLMKYLLRYDLPELRQGPGRIQDLGILLKGKEIDKVLVITSKALLERAVIQPALESMKAEGIDFHVEAFHHNVPNEEDVENCVFAYQDWGRQAIVAIGGQSRIDCAKVTAARIANKKKKIDKLVGFQKVHCPLPPLVAIPTSAGSGSEASIEGVITNFKTGEKRVVRDMVLKPDCIILDPALLVLAPPTTIAQAGMVAICNVVEGFLNKPYRTPKEKEMAVEAMRRLKKSLLKAWNDPSDADAVQDVQYAGMLGARIANRCGHGYTYGLSHAITKFYDIPYGIAVGAILPAVLKRYGRKKQLAELDIACGLCTNVSEDAGSYLYRWIESTRAAMKMDNQFKDLRESDFDEIMRMTLRELLPWYPVPEIWDAETFHGLLRSLQN